MTSTTPIVAIFLTLLLAPAVNGQSATQPGKLDSVRNTKEAPFSSVVNLSVTRRKFFKMQEPRNSTGFLLTPDFVGTAGHNVHSWWLSRVDTGIATGGRSGDVFSWRTTTPFRQRDARNGKGYARWQQPHDYKRDFAGIRLAAPAGVAPAFRLPDGDEINVDTAAIVHIAGFPADSEAISHNGEVMFQGWSPIVGMDDDFIYYKIDVESGMSGSPVWIELKNGDRVVVGIHVAGWKQNGCIFGKAKRLTYEAVKQMREWMRANPPSAPTRPLTGKALDTSC
jgi:V8-like Glu-specific endopeptidase